MGKMLTDRQKAILIEVFKERDAARWIAAIQDESLDFSQIEEACDLLSGEFVSKGTDENSEATHYGLEVEELLNIINRPRLK